MTLSERHSLLGDSLHRLYGTSIENLISSVTGRVLLREGTLFVADGDLHYQPSGGEESIRVSGGLRPAFGQSNVGEILTWHGLLGQLGQDPKATLPREHAFLKLERGLSTSAASVRMEANEKVPRILRETDPSLRRIGSFLRDERIDGETSVMTIGDDLGEIDVFVPASGRAFDTLVLMDCATGDGVIVTTSREGDDHAVGISVTNRNSLADDLHRLRGDAPWRPDAGISLKTGLSSADGTGMAWSVERARRLASRIDATIAELRKGVVPANVSRHTVPHDVEADDHVLGIDGFAR